MNKTHSHRLRIVSVSLLVLLAGCSSKPRDVRAGIDLVEPNSKISGTLIDSIYWAQLSAPETETIDHPIGILTLGPIYLSALGQQCRTVENQATQITRVACSDNNNKNSPAWYLTNSIIQANSALKL